MKKTLIIILALIVGGVVTYLIVDETLPSGKSGEPAEILADKMLQAIGKESWDAIPYITWTFKGKNDYLWDKINHQAEIKWDDFLVKLNLDNQQGIARKEGEVLEGKEKQKLLDEAWSKWANDSFWLNAPAKVRDGGTTRSVVEMSDGTDGLMVEYHSGGVTPGDSYLWALDETGLPLYWKMWVSIIPVGGMDATWSDWQDFDGAKIATKHDVGAFTIEITNLKIGDSLPAMGMDEDYFDELK